MTKELAHRQNDGIEVTLLWHSGDDSVVVSIHDAKTDYAFEVGVPREKALDAFYHPFAYAA
jgi:hypothetical protein